MLNNTMLSGQAAPCSSFEGGMKACSGMPSHSTVTHNRDTVMPIAVLPFYYAE
jgi:hypothetical protein